jgi:hypothetical protein
VSSEAEFRVYEKDHCWQYDIRLRNAEDDLAMSGFTREYVENLTVADFEFRTIDDAMGRAEATEFIKRHEWLGNLSQYTTHWFGAYHDTVLAGVILMNLPNAFSTLLGEKTPELERLISRGACISWSPKNLASAFMMWATRWAVKNTQFRLFTAYSDPMARELGTIYQACNFYYLGQGSGTTTRYINPYSGKVVSDRFFRQRSAYRKYAKELGYLWQPNWTSDTGMLWENIPSEIEFALRAKSKEVQAGAEKIIVPSKHKYALVLGANKLETKILRRAFESRNKILPYPKERAQAFTVIRPVKEVVEETPQPQERQLRLFLA